jgi:hypothetical protein
MKLVCITNKIKGKNLSNQLVVGEEYYFKVQDYGKLTIYYLTSIRDKSNAWLRFTGSGGVDCIWRWFSTKQNIRDKKLKDLGI